MKARTFPYANRIVGRAAACAAVTMLGACAAPAQSPPVQATDDARTIVLDNGIVRVVFSRTERHVTSIVYRHDGQKTEMGTTMYSSYSAAPVKNGVAGSGQVTPAHPTMTLLRSGPDVAEVEQEDGPSATYPFHTETHYLLPRGESGMYVYQVYHHGAGMPAAFLGEARFVIKGKPGTDLYTNHVVDAQRMGPFPASPVERKVMDATFLHTDGTIYTKYNNTAFMADHHVHGMAGHGVGIWMINASNEFVNGGPIKQELTVHEDNTLLDMLQGAHFGAGVLSFSQDEDWTKLYGPFFVYVNKGPSVDALYTDAVKRSDAEIKKWPYAWADGPLYPAKRPAITGTLHLTDNASAGGAWVVLAAPGGDWPLQGKGYEFWTQAGPDGRFTVPNVRPGQYALYAYGANQFEQLERDGVTVVGDGTVDLGTVDWKPVTHGRTLWQIGTPDRSSAEFRDGNDVRHWANYMRYPAEFPDDVTFVVGKSHEASDWNFAQWTWYSKRPYWAIDFDLPKALKGKATLTLGFASANPVEGHHTNLEVKVNGTLADTVHLVKAGAAAYRSGGVDSLYQLSYVTFDAALLKAGRNEITLGHAEAQPFPSRDVQMQGKVGEVMYDAVRLEVEEGK